MKDRIPVETANRPRGFVRWVVVAACFMPALALVSLQLRGRTFSPLCAALSATVLFAICLYTARRQNARAREKTDRLFSNSVRAWGFALLSSLLGGCLTILVYKKYFAAIFGRDDRVGKAAALYDRIPLPAPMKTGLVIAGLLALFLLCALGIYAFLSTAYRREDGGAACGSPVKRYWRNACGLAPVVLCLFFTLVFYGPLDIVLQNAAYLQLQGTDLWPALLGVMLFLTLLVTAALSCMEQGMYGLLRALLFGLALAAYLQGTFFNTDLGSLDGSTVHWSAYAVAAAVGGALWALVALLQIPASRLLREKYTKITVFASLAIIAVQLVALGTVALQGTKASNRTLEGKEEFTLSANENVLVFTLDYFDDSLFDEILELYPEVREEYRDFIRFDNTVAMYNFTFPSLIYMLTGAEFDPTIPTRTYMQNAWEGELASRFYDTLKARGFTRNLYVDANYAALDAYNMRGKADNVVAAPLIITPDMLLETIRLSLYRYAPLCAKEAFWTTTDRLNELAQGGRKDVEPVAVNHRFCQRLYAEGLSLSSRKNRYAWYHLDGAHGPYVVDETGRYVGRTTDQIRQTRGYLAAVAEFLRQMKALGVYDKATVIISADHGCRWGNAEIVLLVKKPFQTHNVMQTTHAPASHKDILPTILSCLGEEYRDFGVSVFDLTEGMQRERAFHPLAVMDDYPAVKWIGSVNQFNMEVAGSKRFNVLLSYRDTGDPDTIRNKIQQDQYDEVIPLYDSFY